VRAYGCVCVCVHGCVCVAQQTDLEDLLDQVELHHAHAQHRQGGLLVVHEHLLGGAARIECSLGQKPVELRGRWTG
jgi:hypothetical protein